MSQNLKSVLEEALRTRIRKSTNISELQRRRPISVRAVVSSFAEQERDVVLGHVHSRLARRKPVIELSDADFLY